eukprot:scaffold5079_cov169-Amphora_coffeaeformis.AAC.2
MGLFEKVLPAKSFSYFNKASQGRLAGKAKQSVQCSYLLPRSFGKEIGAWLWCKCPVPYRLTEKSADLFFLVQSPKGAVTRGRCCRVDRLERRGAGTGFQSLSLGRNGKFIESPVVAIGTVFLCCCAIFLDIGEYGLTQYDGVGGVIDGTDGDVDFMSSKWHLVSLKAFSIGDLAQTYGIRSPFPREDHLHKWEDLGKANVPKGLVRCVTIV